MLGVHGSARGRAREARARVPAGRRHRGVSGGGRLRLGRGLVGPGAGARGARQVFDAWSASRTPATLDRVRRESCGLLGGPGLAPGGEAVTRRGEGGPGRARGDAGEREATWPPRARERAPLTPRRQPKPNWASPVLPRAPAREGREIERREIKDSSN